MTTFTGSIPTISSGQTAGVSTALGTYRDALKALSEPWTSYTPAWTGTTNPAIGNGTQVWKYQRVDKFVRGRIQITMGTTTTFGTGNWVFGLPVAVHADYTINMHLGQGDAVDLSAPAYAHVHALQFTSTSVFLITAAGTTVAGAVPWTWASGDKLSIEFEYEAA